MNDTPEFHTDVASNAPDPKTAREIAREHLSDFLSKFPMADTTPFFVGSRVLESVGDPELWRTNHPAYIAWCDAVAAEIRAALPAWPDEQPQAERDADVRAVAAVFRWLKADQNKGLLRVGPNTQRALLDLTERFADRIAAIEARDAEGGE